MRCEIHKERVRDLADSFECGTKEAKPFWHFRQFLYLLDNKFDTDGDQKLTLKEIRPIITKGSEEGLKATFAELDFN